MCVCVCKGETENKNQTDTERQDRAAETELKGDPKHIELRNYKMGVTIKQNGEEQVWGVSVAPCGLINFDISNRHPGGEVRQCWV